MVDKIFSPNTFDEYLSNALEASFSRSYGAKLAPVKQWERDEFGIYCSCCGFYAYRDQFGQPWKSNFCPNCGANLREEEKKMTNEKAIDILSEELDHTVFHLKNGKWKAPDYYRELSDYRDALQLAIDALKKEKSK